MSYPNSCVSHTSYASYASPLYLDPWHKVVLDLSDLENMLSDSGSAETFPTDDDAETEAFPLIKKNQTAPQTTTLSLAMFSTKIRY